MSKISSKISFSGLSEVVRESERRFPFTVIYLVGLTLWMMYLIICPYDKEPQENVIYSISYLTAVGVPLTLAVSLWSEWRSQHGKIIMAAANILLWCDSIYIMCCEEVPSTWFVGRCAVITALCIGILFSPIDGDKSWGYSYKAIKALFIAMIFSALFGFCWGIVTITVQILFGVYKLGYDILLSFIVPGSVSLPFMLFLSLLPKVQEFDATTSFSRFDSGTTKFFILPLTAIYFLVLYIYLIKIVAGWTLPTDSVSWPVAMQVAAVMILLWCLHGERQSDPSSRMAVRLPRIITVLMFPLLVLASVAIIYRVREYGWTAPRLYVAAFNLWCYGAFIYLLFAKRERLNMVALSFATVFVALSIIPYANLTYIGSRLEREKTAEADAGKVTPEAVLSIPDEGDVDIPEGFKKVNTFSVSGYDGKSTPVMFGSGCLDMDVDGTIVSIPADSLMLAEKAGRTLRAFHVVSATGDSIFCIKEIFIRYKSAQSDSIEKIDFYNASGFIFIK